MGREGLPLGVWRWRRRCGKRWSGSVSSVGDSSPSSSASPQPHAMSLPGIHSLASASSSPSPVSSSSNGGNTSTSARARRSPEQSEELAKEIGRIELESRTREIPPEERRQHAELIRNLLVAINMDFKERFGVKEVIEFFNSTEGMFSRNLEMVVGKVADY